MALSNTQTLDIPHLGGCAIGIIQLTAAPNIDTTTLDVPHMGGAYVWIQDVTVGAVAGTPGSPGLSAPDWLLLSNWGDRWRHF